MQLLPTEKKTLAAIVREKIDWERKKKYPGHCAHRDEIHRRLDARWIEYLEEIEKKLKGV